MTRVSIEYFGMEGSGKTVTEAKRDAGSKIEKAMSGSYSPSLIKYKCISALCYREPRGWSYLILTDEVGAMREENYKSYPCTHFVGDRKDCLNSAAFHIIQNGMNVHEVYCDADLPDILTDKCQRSELVSWARWQRAAYYARNVLKIDDNQIHQWACDHDRDEQFSIRCA